MRKPFKPAFFHPLNNNNFNNNNNNNFLNNNNTIKNKYPNNITIFRYFKNVLYFPANVTLPTNY